MPKIRWLLGVVVTLFALPSSVFGFDIKHTGNAIYINGEIVTGDFAKFKGIVRAYGIAPVYLESLGGQVTEALNIGEYIRSKGMETRLARKARCASACVLILAGGLIRSAHDSAQIGLHMSSGIFNDEFIEMTREIVNEKGPDVVPIIVSLFESKAGLITLKQVDYYLRMGVSLDMLQLATSVHHLEIEWINHSKALSFNIINTN